jgi:hypothetical protein
LGLVWVVHGWLTVYDRVVAELQHDFRIDGVARDEDSLTVMAPQQNFTLHGTVLPPLLSLIDWLCVLTVGEFFF